MKRLIPILLWALLFCAAPRRASACDVDNPPRLFAAAMNASATPLSPDHTLKLRVQSGWLPNSPTLVRVEVLNAAGERDLGLWDGEATIFANTTDVTLSTNRVVLRNGLGSALVAIKGPNADFNLMAVFGDLHAEKTIKSLAAVPVTRISGALPGSSSVWSGVILLTNDTTVPAGHTLTIASNTLVLVNGTASGSTAPRLIVNGAVNSLGTEDFPVTFTSPDMSLNWGQIRHINAQPSTYRHTTICKAGRATGEGHTGTGPMVKLVGSIVTFTGCNISDAVANTITNGIGKIMQADASNLTFDDCLLTRARMGPEIASTALLCTNTYIMEMYGPDDADGIYLHDAGGQVLRIRGSVIASGNDDGVDTLGSDVEIDDTIIRDFCDKGVSVLDGRLWVDHALIVDHANGISAKSQSSNVTIPIEVDHSTIVVAENGIAVINKYGGQTNVNGIYNVTNTIIRAALSVVTDYDPANFHLGYCNLTPSFSGPGNTPSNNGLLERVIMNAPEISTNFPLFINQRLDDFRLGPGSPCIDRGNPAYPLDPDGSRTDVGYFTFVPPPPQLTAVGLTGGGFDFILSGYTNRNYEIEASESSTNWSALRTIFQTRTEETVRDQSSTNVPRRFYRARLAH